MGSKAILTLIIVVIIVAVFVIYFTLRGVQSTYIGSDNTKSVEGTQTEVKNIVNVGQVIDDPLVYDDLTIEVESVISDWITKRSFTLLVPAQGGIFGGARKQLLVIAKKDFPLPQNATKEGIGIGELVNVHIKGKARIMDRTELGQQLGLDLDGNDIKLDDNTIDKWEEGSVIIIESVKKI